MGGIAGMLSFTRERADTQPVERMLERLAHRGPDDRGLGRSDGGRLVLGGCLMLAAAGRGMAAVPCRNESGDVWAVIDGEIDNQRALSQSLRLDGHDLRGDSAGELVVHAYEQFGVDFLHHLHGGFALALWDEARHRLLLARDRMGERPLYWSRGVGLMAFASEARVLPDCLGVPAQLDLERLPEFFACGLVAAPYTLLDGVRKLGPGEALVVERASRLRPIHWWSPCHDLRRVEAIRALTAEHHQNNLRVLVESAIADRLGAMRPIAAVVDGDPASLAMAAAMGRLLGRRPEVLAFGDDLCRRLAPAASAAGLRLTAVNPDQSLIFERLADCWRAMDEPLADPMLLSWWWICRALAGSGLPAALAALGSWLAWPGSGRPAGPGRSAPWRLGVRMVAAFRALLGGIAAGTAERGSPAELMGLLTPQLRRRLKPAERPPRRFALAVPSALSDDGATALAYAESRSTLADGVLLGLDHMSMAHSVTLRMPLLDDALVDYLLSIGASGGLPPPSPGALLAAALKGLGPFGEPAGGCGELPLGAWFRGELAELFRAAVARGRLFDAGVLDRRSCFDLLEEHRIGRADHGRQLWALLCLCSWVELNRVDCPAAMLDEAVRLAVGS